MSSLSPSALAGRTALVTGAGSGIGQATARALAAVGASVAVLDRNAEALVQTSDLVAGAGGTSHAFTADLSDEQQLRLAVTEVQDRCGTPDMLINCAALAGRVMKIADTTDELWRETEAVNLRAPFLLIKYVSEQMISAGRGGRIVNVTSSAAYRAHAPAAYGVAKSALAHLTRIAAAELGPYDINVNAVAPGLTRTPPEMALRAPAEFEAAVREGPLANLLHRVSEPEDVANAIVFLCLPESRQLTGQTLHVSAGLVI